ncbi:MAG: hypothetical protein QOE11_3319 [Solirubrobacteraceae bacterium]|nr:hypothetical protein [Solirubrobacteraceae bacterium]
MKGLLSTRAARAWLVVALVGLVVVVLVLALGLLPRLSAGQRVIDAAGPAFTDDRVAGERAGADFISSYVDFAGPLMTTRGGGSREIPSLVALISRRSGLSAASAAALLRREAPHTEALLRALPLSGVSREIPALTRYLATTLNITDEALAAQFEQSFPRLAQVLTALPSVTSGWNDIPGMDGMTRFDDRTVVRSMPRLRDYLRDDLVGAVEHEKDDFQAVAGSGGVGYIPKLLLVIGVAMALFGLFGVRRARKAPPGGLSWALVVATGLLVVVLVGILQYFPRLNGADRVVSGLQPAFTQARVAGDRAGSDMLDQAVLFGDPIATRRGGASAEVPRLVALVSRQTNVPQAKVLAALRRRAPRTIALAQAIPLSAVAGEVPHLLSVLGRRLKLRRPALLAALQRRTPRLAQSLLTVRTVALRWRSIPGTSQLTRFDATTPVQTMPALAAYLDKDVVPVFEGQRQSFGDLADPWPPLNELPPLLLGVGLLVALYGLAMMRFATRRW